MIEKRPQYMVTAYAKSYMHSDSYFKELDDRDFAICLAEVLVEGDIMRHVFVTDLHIDTVIFEYKQKGL